MIIPKIFRWPVRLLLLLIRKITVLIPIPRNIPAAADTASAAVTEILHIPLLNAKPWEKLAGINLAPSEAVPTAERFIIQPANVRLLIQSSRPGRNASAEPNVLMPAKNTATAPLIYNAKAIINSATRINRGVPVHVRPAA